jgi:hypothetical protein
MQVHKEKLHNKVAEKRPQNMVSINIELCLFHGCLLGNSEFSLTLSV